MLADGFEFAAICRLYPDNRIWVDAHNLREIRLLNLRDCDNALGRQMIPTELAEGSTDQAVPFREVSVLKSLCEALRIFTNCLLLCVNPTT